MIIDILYAFLYDYRSMDMESTSESAWCVNKLSTTLSGLVYQTDVKETIKCCFRRVLCYHLFRNFDLATKVKNDLECVFKIGSRLILKLLLMIRTLFQENETRFLLNALYIDDLIVFAHSLDDEEYKVIQKEISKTIITKACIGLEIVEYEAEAHQIMEEDSSDEKPP